MWVHPNGLLDVTAGWFHGTGLDPTPCYVAIHRGEELTSLNL